MQDTNHNMDDSPKSRMLYIETDEINDFPNANSIIAILIPCTQQCYTLWQPIKAGMDEQTFHNHLTRSMASAAQIYYNQQHQDIVDISVLGDMDVPHIEEIVPILVTAYEKCRSIWVEDDFDHTRFSTMFMNLMSLIGLKMYRNGW